MSGTKTGRASVTDACLAAWFDDMAEGEPVGACAWHATAAWPTQERRGLSLGRPQGANWLGDVGVGRHRAGKRSRGSAVAQARQGKAMQGKAMAG